MFLAPVSDRLETTLPARGEIDFRWSSIVRMTSYDNRSTLLSYLPIAIFDSAKVYVLENTPE
jgi:hypothetical protein